jgi:hypothetical protein
MSAHIKLYDFLSSKRILHDDLSTDSKDATEFLVKNAKIADIVSYDHTKHIAMYNVAMLEVDKDGKHFYEYNVNRDNIDIIQNIHTDNQDLKLSYYAGGVEYTSDELTEFILCAAMYSDFKIRVTFLKKPKSEDEFKIYSRHYIVSGECGKDRKELMKNTIITNNILYYNGCSLKVKDLPKDQLQKYYK